MNRTTKKTASITRERTNLSEFFPISISETDIQESEKSGKRELVVTLLREGAGNQFHKNYYTRGALDTAKKRIEEGRRKMYFNHSKDLDNPERDIRDWASSIVEAWVDTTEPKAKLMGRIQVLDSWLWERAKTAPQELAVSIEGRGTGKPQKIDGQDFNAIEEIGWLNGMSWVDYPGNAGMGVQVLEREKQNLEEEQTMTLKEIIESFQKMTVEEKQEFLTANPELKALMPAPAAENDKLAALAAEVKAIKENGDAKVAALTDQVKTLSAENNKLGNQVEAHNLKEKEVAKERLIEKMLGASKLKDAHKTDTFRKTLLAVEEYKSGEKLVTVEEQVKALIEDREKICIAEVAKPGQEGAGATTTTLTEEQQHRSFNLHIFGVDTAEVKETAKRDDTEGDLKAKTA